MSNLAKYHIGTLWIDEDNYIPVNLETDAGADLTGVASGAIVVKIAEHDDTSLQTFVPSAAQWTELGRGEYRLTLPASIVTIEGDYICLVDTVASGNKTFRGAGQVEQRPEDRLLEEVASGHNVAGSVGEAIIDAAEQYEVFAVPAYDQTTQTLTVLCWLQKNGQRITTPTDCRVILKESGVTTIFDELDATPTADGVFSMTSTPLAINANKTFECLARITYGGVQYTSIDGFTTFN